MTEKLKQKAEEYLKHFTSVLSAIGDKTVILKDIENAYIAGAEENGIQWHDLRKDPKDLPKEVKNGRSKVVYGDKGEPIYFSYKTNWWKDYLDHERYPPVAWCEIPTFER